MYENRKLILHRYRKIEETPTIKYEFPNSHESGSLLMSARRVSRPTNVSVATGWLLG
jgi:hypothetical protein